MKIKQTRRNVARIMTALSVKSHTHFKKELTKKLQDGRKEGKTDTQINSEFPKKLRPKKTRALRRALPTKFVNTLVRRLTDVCVCVGGGGGVTFRLLTASTLNSILAGPFG